MHCSSFSHTSPPESGRDGECTRMLWQSTATPFSIIKLVGQNITTGHKKCHSLVEKCTGQPQKARQTIEENKEEEKESCAGGGRHLKM